MNEQKNTKGCNQILTALFLNIFFVFVEVAGGFLTNSFAIFSDALHDAGDCVAIGFAYAMEKFSRKAPDEKYTYGYRRYSLLSAFVTSVLLVLSSVFVFVGGIKSLCNPRQIRSGTMLLTAAFGVAVNGAAVFLTRKGTGLNGKAINIHLLEDVLGWVAILIGSLLIHFFDFDFIDGVLSLCIAVFLMASSVKNICGVFEILLEKTPKRFDVAAYREKLACIEGAEDIHHLHIWSIDDERIAASLHVRAADNTKIEDYCRIKCDVEEISRSFGVEHLTVQVDVVEHYEGSACGA